jgi:FAD/FMN-containing dehydrogenase
MLRIHGWGNFPSIDSEVFFPKSLTDASDLIKNNINLIPRGFGRSYGDSANSKKILQSNYLNRFISFDQNNGVLSCDAGISINEILNLIVPRGWFIPVAPGTSFVSLGGAIASDVHGKNHHHQGCFSKHLLSFELMLADGSITHVSQSHLPDLFHATCGGMGLTGFIVSACVQLIPIKSSQITQSLVKCGSLEEVCDQFYINRDKTYSVAWIDCLSSGKSFGRSILIVGEHSETGNLIVSKKAPINIPFNMPTTLLNSYSIRLFNSIYYHGYSSKSDVNISYQKFFYPLDGIRNWNRLYGKAGFIQYQFVIPMSVGIDGLKKILVKIVDSGLGSFLAVLKCFGPANANYLSFPIEGFTLALDFKLSDSVIRLIANLDPMVIDIGGRIYLTKDALMSDSTFKSSYPLWEDFERVRSKYGAIGKFSSIQSKRLGLQ